MTLLVVLCVFYLFGATIGQPNVLARDACSPFNGNEVACNNHQFVVPGYGVANCVYVPLTSLEPTGNPLLAEEVCLPDHCGLFLNNQTRCEQDIYCSWENDPTTQRADVYRCFPACFNKIDLMFLVDGTTSQVNTVDPVTGLTNFQINLQAIQEFVRRVPDKGFFNDVYETREYYISFGGQIDGGGFNFPSTLDFDGSELLTQEEAGLLVMSLTGPEGGTNLRRALTETYFLFAQQTKPDAQRMLFLFTDGAATDAEYLQFQFPHLGIADFSDEDLRISLGQINCDSFGSLLCQPVQYHDLGPALWDPLDVYYQFYLLGDEVQVFPPGMESNGPVFAENFVVNATSDIIPIIDNDFSVFTDSSSVAGLIRVVDASICSAQNAPNSDSCGTFNESNVVCYAGRPVSYSSCNCTCDLDFEIGNLLVDESCIGVLSMWRIREGEGAAITPVTAGVWRRADGFRIGRNLYEIDPSTCVTITCEPDGSWEATTCVNNIATCRLNVTSTMIVPRGYFGGPPKEPRRNQAALPVV